MSDSAQNRHSLNVPQSSAKVSEISHIDQLIKGIHDRVSAYVLLKVEKQVERLIELDNYVPESDIPDDSIPYLTTKSDATNVKCDLRRKYEGNTDSSIYNDDQHVHQSESTIENPLHDLPQTGHVKSVGTPAASLYHVESRDVPVYTPSMSTCDSVIGQLLFHQLPTYVPECTTKKPFLRQSSPTNLMK